jgi:D-alanine-D-alanine ligase
MKRVCTAWGIGTPAYVIAEQAEDVARAAAMLRYPLIVKHPSSYSSIGLTRASRVLTDEALHALAATMIEAFGGALIEEFIDGREFTVLVAEHPDDAGAPTAYQPVEFCFPAGESFKHFDLKWIDYQGMTCVPCTDAALALRLKEMACKLFVGLGGASYGRCDIRMDAGGGLHMLEINPNCGVFYPPENPGSADFILSYDPAGHEGFTAQIIEAALRRRERRRKPWVVRAGREGNYGLYATLPIRAGGGIEAYEEQPHVLVTRDQVEQHWGAGQKAWFEGYAYPLTDDLYVAWSSSPEDWKPINHSCDPNAWLEGLNLAARRDIAPGEEITLDYATFCNEAMRPFPCSCGTAHCRAVIRGTDYLQPFVERYGRHVSGYVRAKRQSGSAPGEAAVPRAGGIDPSGPEEKPS